MLDVLDLSSVQGWADAAAQALEWRRHEIDALNVFPVPDADTGTNLAMTMRAAQVWLATAVSDSSAVDAATALRAMARGAALAARGNSGVIMAELLRGLAGAVDGETQCDAITMRAAFERACTTAYAAVGQPVEGTILSVVRAVATATSELPPDASLADVVTRARDSAVDALARTQDQLRVLADAGVVDAGGRGLVVVLDALCGIVTDAPSVLEVVAAPDRRRGERRAEHRSADAGYGYEVQYLLDTDAAGLATVRATLAALGDSLTTAQVGESDWNVHIHVDDVGAAIEAGVAVGRPSRIVVTRFDDASVAAAGVSVVVLLRSSAVAPLLQEGGGEVVVIASARIGDAEGDGADDDIVDLLRAPGSLRYVLLPADEQLAAIAHRAVRRARDHGIEVAVVPCRSPMQVLAALAVHDEIRRFDENVIAMAEAAAATRFARVEIAAGPGLTTIGACRAGDVLGLIDGEVVEIGPSTIETTRLVLARLLGVGGELLTVIVGADARNELEPILRAEVAAQAPFVELVIYPDPQLDCFVLLGLE